MLQITSSQGSPLQQYDSPWSVALPIGAKRGHATLELSEAPIDGGELHDPFFADTLARLPLVQVARTEIPRAALRHIAPEHAPAGLIFHVARCGSTLLANLLRELPETVVYSEPPAFNDILMPPFGNWSEQEIVASLRLVARGLSQAAGNQPYIVKCRSWNTLFIRLLLKAFPSTPWVFLTRDPIEVAVSVMRKPPTWLRAHRLPANPFLPFLKVGSELVEQPERYLAEILRAFTQAVADADRSNGRLLTYTDLPGAAWKGITAHFGFLPSAQVLEAMRRRAEVYSKDPSARKPFNDDSAAKQAVATPELRRMIFDHATPSFLSLAESWNDL